MPAANDTAGHRDDLWPALRRHLQAAALLEAESIPGVGPPYLRFHPTLAPMLWTQLDPQSQHDLTEAHRRRYYELAAYIYDEDDSVPQLARAIAWRDMPNLLHAVYRGLDANDPDAADFANCVSRFLTNFGFTREVRVARPADGDCRPRDRLPSSG